MPLFFLLFLIVAIRVAFLPGTMDGYAFLVRSEMGGSAQSRHLDYGHGTGLFSLSITGSGMIVYGAYLDKSADIPAASLRTALFDTLAAMLSALAIMPAVFALELTPLPALAAVPHAAGDF